MKDSRMINRRDFVRCGAAGLIGLALAVNSGCTTRLLGETPKLDPNCSLSEIADFVKRHRIKEIDYENIWPRDYKIIFFGDNHSAVNDEYDLVQNLPLYRAQGATHLAVELYAEKFSDIIKKFYNGELSDEELRRILIGFTIGDKGQGEYTLIKTARELGIETVCMDTNYPDTDERHHYYGEIDSRNKFMAETLIRIIDENESARVIAHSGAIHFGYFGLYAEENKWGIYAKPVGEYLKAKGIDAFKVTHAGGRKRGDEGLEYDINGEPAGGLRRVIEVAAKKLKIEKEKFGLVLDETVTTRNWGHFLIHLPQED